MSVTCKAHRESPAMNRFQIAVRKRIAAMGITMAELARRADVARPYLYRILDGTQEPTMPVAERIAEEVGLSIETLPKKNFKKVAG